MPDLFYYLERIPGTPNSFRIGFRLYEHWSTASNGTLTVANGQPYTWEYEDYFVGDYMVGASYGTEDSVVFVVPWSQNGGLYFNTVTVPLGPVKPEIENVLVPFEPIPPLIDPVIANPDSFTAEPRIE